MYCLAFLAGILINLIPTLLHHSLIKQYYYDECSFELPFLISRTHRKPKSPSSTFLFHILSDSAAHLQEIEEKMFQNQIEHCHTVLKIKVQLVDPNPWNNAFY